MSKVTDSVEKLYALRRNVRKCGAEHELRGPRASDCETPRIFSKRRRAYHVQLPKDDCHKPRFNTTRRLGMKHSLNQTSQSNVKSLATWAAVALLLGVSTLAFTLAPAAKAFGEGTSSCESARAELHDAKAWVARYQPLAARGGVYRKAFEQALIDSTSAHVRFQEACKL